MSDSAARGGAGGSEAEAPESDAGGSAGTSEFDERSLLFLVVPEVVAFAGLCVVLASSVLGDGTFLASYPLWLRIAGFCVAAVQCLVVVGVYLDVRRRPEMGTLWVHAAAMPVLNVFGLAAYLAERDRKARERDDGA